jgi:hypothetical protein
MCCTTVLTPPPAPETVRYAGVEDEDDDEEVDDVDEYLHDADADADDNEDDGLEDMLIRGKHMFDGSTTIPEMIERLHAEVRFLRGMLVDPGGGLRHELKSVCYWSGARKN